MYSHRPLFTASPYLHQDPYSQEHATETSVICLALCLSGARTHKNGTGFFLNKQKEFIFLFLSTLPVVK